MTDQSSLRNLLQAVGLKRHGKAWRSRLAEEWECHRSSVARWMRPEGHKDHRPIPKWVEREIRRWVAVSEKQGKG